MVGIYGLTEKIGWEDLILFFEDGRRIGRVCLQTKQYIRDGWDDVKKVKGAGDLAKAMEHYLNDNQFHFWYYYPNKGDEDFYEVPYAYAPKNKHGIKPSSIEIWHPDEQIGISTIKSAVKEFAQVFLHIENCTVKIENIEKYTDSIRSFTENEQFFGGAKPVQIAVSQEVITELSHLWGKTEEEVLAKLTEISH